MPKHASDKRAGTQELESAKKTKRDAAAAADEGDKPKSPYDEFFERLNAFQTANNIIGQMLIKGIPRGADSEGEESEDEDSEAEAAGNARLTKEQMDTLRFVLITLPRADALEKMRRHVLGDQADDCIMMFDTSFSYGVKDGFYRFKHVDYAKKKQWSDRFDLLFAYTHTLGEFDVWMQDNEGDMDGMVADLAKMWKALLKKSDDELGIDGEYTRPGVMAMLEDFKESVEGCYSDPPFRFRYK